MQCPNCQHWNETGSRFCEECGIELPQNGDAAPQVTVRPAVSTQPPSSLPEQTAPPLPTPPPPLQPLIPIEETPATPYTGPRLILKATGSIFKLGDASVLGREDPTLNIDFDGYPDGKYVSHRHAQVVKIKDTYYVEDLGSANHTYVNERKLASGQAEPIEDGDVIRVGKIEMIFYAS
jgi:hypothetical protein